MKVTVHVRDDIALLILCPHEGGAVKLEITKDAKAFPAVAAQYIREFLEEHKDCNAVL